MPSSRLAPALPFIAAGLLALGGCGDGPEADPRSPTGSTTSAAGAPRPTAPLSTLGAAHWVPADAAWFSSTHGLGVLLRDVWNSRAVQRLLALRPVRDVLEGAERDIVASLAEVRRELPLLDELLTLSAEGLDRELFALAGAEMAPIAEAAMGMLGESWGVAAAEAMDPLAGRDPAARVFAAFERHRDGLRLPPIVVGMRVASVARAEAFAAQLVASTDGLFPAPWTELEVGGGTFHTTEFELAQIPAWMPALSRGLEGSDLSPAQSRTLVRWLGDQTVALAVGMRGDHLLFSIGTDHALLGSLGASSLAASPAWAPLRKHHAQDLLSLTYLAPSMRLTSALPGETILEAVANLAPAAPAIESRANGEQRLMADLQALIAEIRGAAPAPTPYLSASYRHRGIETFTFGERDDGARADRPLAILRHAGSAPLALMASRAPEAAPFYGRFVHWVGVFWKHFEALAVPSMDEHGRGDFEAFRATLMPAVEAIHRVTRDELLPAAEESENLLVIDGEWRVDELPEIGRLPGPVRVPRPTLAWRVRDAGALVEAFASYRQIVNELLGRFVEAGHQHLADVRIPAPDQRPFFGGTLFTFFDAESIPGLDPNVVVRDDLVVASLDPMLAESMLEAGDAIGSEVVDFAAPASGAVWVDLAGWVELVGEAMTGVGRPPAEIVEVVRAVSRTLGSLRTYRSRTYRDGSTRARHSWLQVDDRD